MCFRIKINGNLHTRKEAEKLFEVMTLRIKELQANVVSANEATNRERQKNIVLTAELAALQAKQPKRDSKTGRFVKK